MTEDPNNAEKPDENKASAAEQGTPASSPSEAKVPEAASASTTEEVPYIPNKRDHQKFLAADAILGLQYKVQYSRADLERIRDNDKLDSGCRKLAGFLLDNFAVLRNVTGNTNLIHKYTIQDVVKNGKKLYQKAVRNGVGWLDIEAIGFFGVLLPAVTLGFEYLFHMCGGAYVDPIPSWFHFAAILFVATANGIGWIMVMQKNVTAPWLPFMLGTSIGISVFYALIFLPLVPLACILIAFIGLGLLPLSPLFSFICAIRLALIVKRQRKESATPLKMTGIFKGVATGVLILVAAELPNAITDVALRQAASTNAQTSRAGVRLLRTFGNEQSLLRSCYHHTASVSDIPTMMLTGMVNNPFWQISGLDINTGYFSVEDARNIYYRAFGRPFNSVARPHFGSGYGNLGEDDRYFWDYDAELAGENVGGRTAGVSLSKSELSTAVDPDAATSYSEWTMVFNNQSLQDQEARMQVELPPGGVVSRATLWVNGQPREAAFGERGLVRRAYQSVVRKRRDPLLVTAVGPNKVMLQCYPVPSRKGQTPGEIKVRIGITAPCVVPEIGQTQLTLPRIAEHGFPVACKHEVKIESPQAFTCSEKSMHPLDDATTKRLLGTLDDKSFRDAPITFQSGRDANLSALWSSTPLGGGKSFIVEELKRQEPSKPDHLYVVIDGSTSMSKYVPQVTEALAKIPPGVATEVIFASDEISQLVDNKSPVDLNVALQELKHAPCVGGPNNAAPLKTAWEKATKQPNSAVMWIHGPQPVVFGGYDSYSAFESRRCNNPKHHHYKPVLYDVEAFPSPNRFLEGMPQTVTIQQVPRPSDLKTDLQRFISGMYGTGPADYVIARNTTSEKPLSRETIPLISTQLVSLWAFDETLDLLHKEMNPEAVKLAARHRLVTPVTGAVVLETDEDYKNNGIDPTDPDKNTQNSSATPGFSMGAAPEPEENALMLLALMAMAWQIWRKKLFARKLA